MTRLGGSWCNNWCNRLSGIVRRRSGIPAVGSRCSHFLVIRFWTKIEVEHRQCVQCPVNVEQLRICVDVHRHVDLAVSHRSLRCARRNTAFAQQCSDGMPKSVNINCSSPFISLGDAGGKQIPIENPDQTRRNPE